MPNSSHFSNSWLSIKYLCLIVVTFVGAKYFQGCSSPNLAEQKLVKRNAKSLKNIQRWQKSNCPRASCEEPTAAEMLYQSKMHEEAPYDSCASFYLVKDEVRKWDTIRGLPTPIGSLGFWVEYIHKEYPQIEYPDTSPLYSMGVLFLETDVCSKKLFHRTHPRTIRMGTTKGNYPFDAAYSTSEILILPVDSFWVDSCHWKVDSFRVNRYESYKLYLQLLGCGEKHKTDCGCMCAYKKSNFLYFKN
jgi:hypothetical protein